MRGKYTHMYDSNGDLIRTFIGDKRKVFSNVRLNTPDYLLELFGTMYVIFSALDKSNYEVPDTFVIAFGYNHIYGVK